MAIVKMKQVSLVGLKQEKKALLQQLARLGVIDVQEDKDPGIKLAHETERQAAAYREDISEMTIRLERLSDMIKLSSDLRHIKKPMFTVRRQIDPLELVAAGDRSDEIMSVAHRLEQNRLHKVRLNEQLITIQARRDALEAWQDLVLPEIDRSSFNRLSLLLGTMPDEQSLADARAELEVALESFAIQIIKRIEGGIGLAVLMLHEEEAFGERILHQHHFARFPETGSGVRKGDMAAAYLHTESEIKRIREELLELEAEALRLAEHKEDFELLHDYFQVQISELTSAAKLVETNHIFVLRGYIPADRASAAIGQLTEQFELATSLRDPEADEDFPILLENYSMVAPFESIVETFSMPKPNVDPDPTFVMSLFYALSFGLILGDVGYGALLSLLCGILVWKVGVEGNMRKMCIIFFQSGLVGMFFGLLFGGFFGNALTEITQGAVNFPTLWFSPIDDPIKMMTWSIIFGVLHIFAGMGLDVYKKIKNGDTYGAIFSVVPWFAIIIGLGLMLLGIDWAQWMALGGAIVLVLFSSRSRNPFKRIFGGLGGLYGITGYFSDLLSYTRILALGLCTSVIAMVVNMMAMLPGVKGIGIIFFTLIMILGHALNLALSGLSAYVHTTRLQYVEFFGKFYDGGGNAFAPLMIDTKYTKPIVRVASKS